MLNAVRRLTGLCVLLAGLSLGGCVSSSLQAPDLTLVNVSMVSADIFSQQFRIRLLVQNPNDRELPIKGLEYELYLQGDSFADGFSEKPFIVPPHGEKEFDTMVRTQFVSSIARLLTKLNANGGTAGKVEYAFIGKVHLSKGIVRKIPFSESGLVDLSRMK